MGRLLSLCSVLGPACALAACASMGSGCPGGPLRLADGSSARRIGPVQAAPLIVAHRQTADLHCLAQSGDKYAQFALGHAYENGIGVPRDHDAARWFFGLAAQDMIGTRQVYSAPVGSESTGTGISIPGQVIERGLPEAREALRRLNESQR